MKKSKIRHFTIRTLCDAKIKTSLCWRYFGDLIFEEDSKKKKVLDDQVFCNACLSDALEDNFDISFGLAKIKSYARTVSTGNLNRHLRKVHNIVEQNTSHSLPTAGAVTSKRDSLMFAGDLALWFCKSLMPFDLVADEGMMDFFQKYGIVASKSDMPTKNAVCSALDDIYESMLGNVKAQITTDAAKHATITFDLWTNPSKHLNYITFTLHYLTVDFEYHSFTLNTNLIEDKDAWSQIQTMFNNTKECFGLEGKKLHSVSHASGLNVKCAISHAELDSHLCLGHGLHNLVTVDGIGSVPEIVQLINKCKKIVRTICYRLPLMEREAVQDQIEFFGQIERVSENLVADENEPISNEKSESSSGSSQVRENEFGKLLLAPTRWHCVLAMLENLTHFSEKNTINKMLSRFDQEHLNLYRQDWNVLEDLTRFLRKFREVAEMLLTQKAALLNSALVFHLEIKDVLNSITDEETLIVQTLKSKMLAKLDKRLPITDKIVVAALLDPRFINLSLIDTYLEGKHTTREAFLAEYIKKHIDNPSDASPIDPLAYTRATTSKESVLSRLSRKHSSNTSSSLAIEYDVVGQECWTYLTTANAKSLKNDDILQYWQDMKNTFPVLSKLARAVLAIPATSTPSERILSEAGLIHDAKRSRLNPTQVNKIIFIYGNYSLYSENLQLD